MLRVNDKSARTGAASGSQLERSDFVRMRFDAFELDEVNARLLREGRPVALTPTPFAVLCALVRRPGSLLMKNDLLDAVWGHRFVSDSVLKTAISELRTALDDDARRPRYIETVSRRGYRFIGIPTSVPAALQPASLRATAVQQAPSIIGRAHALARLRGAWDLACSGRRQLVWAAGDPGIGKTTLIDHFVSALGEVTSARGQCVEQHGKGEPYLPILEALAELCRRDAAMVALLRAVAPAWLVQLPWLSTPEERDGLRRELAGTSQDRMLRELGELLDRYTQQRPLLLVTEDVHWSDSATIQLMDHIARGRGNLRLMWLATYRLAEVIAYDHPLKTLRNELRLHGLCEEIVLEAFSEQEVAEFIAQRAPSLAANETFVRALHARTDGLPLFVAHIVNDLVTRMQAGDRDASAAPGPSRMAIPENLAGIIDQYIARLSIEQRVVLEAAAVCGMEFRVGTVGAVLGRDAAAVAATCDELARGQLWLNAPAEDGNQARDMPYRFRHALFRQWLYERTGPLARTKLHAKVGAALERERAAGAPVTAAALAVHFDYGRDPMAAVSCYAEAAGSALLHFSPREAMSLTERGLALLAAAEPGQARDALEITLATLRGVAAAHLLGVSATEAKAAFQRAHALLSSVPRHPSRGLLLHEFGFVLCMRAEYAEALAMAERTERLSQAAQDPLLLLGACTVQANLQMLYGRPRLSRGWVERFFGAMASLDEASPASTLVVDPSVAILGWLAIDLLHLGLVEQARARLEEARAHARRLAQPMAQGVALWLAAMFEVRLGNADCVADLAREMQAITDESDFAHGRVACRWFRGWAQAHSGDPRGGYRLLREAYEENERLGMHIGASEVLGYGAEALVLAGDWAAARKQLDEALQIADAFGERIYLPQLLLTEAAIADARGEAAVACECFRRAIAEARAQEAPWLELITLLAFCESDHATAEDRRALAAVIEQLPEAGNTQAVTRARALLGAAAERSDASTSATQTGARVGSSYPSSTEPRRFADQSPKRQR